MESEVGIKSPIYAIPSGRALGGCRIPYNSCWRLERSHGANTRTYVDGCAVLVFLALWHLATGKLAKCLLAMEVVDRAWGNRLRSLFNPLLCTRLSLSNDLVD